MKISRTSSVLEVRQDGIIHQPAALVLEHVEDAASRTGQLFAALPSRCRSKHDGGEEKLNQGAHRA